MKWTIPKIITVSALSGALLVGAAGGAYAMGATSHHAAAAASPAPVTKTVTTPKPKPKPTPAKTIYVQPVQQAPVQQAPPAPAPQQFTNSVAVVDQFYQDITDRNYAAAWTLGGKYIGGQDYASWVNGYATTASISLYDEADWGSGQVHAYLSAVQSDGTTRTYAGTYPSATASSSAQHHAGAWPDQCPPRTARAGLPGRLGGRPDLTEEGQRCPPPPRPAGLHERRGPGRPARLGLRRYRKLLPTG
jgi:hypothetical protein